MTNLIDKIEKTIEDKLVEMGANVEVTFIRTRMLSIAAEDQGSFDIAKGILALTGCALDSEAHDNECGHFAYYTF